MFDRLALIVKQTGEIRYGTYSEEDLQNSTSAAVDAAGSRDLYFCGLRIGNVLYTSVSTYRKREADFIAKPGTCSVSYTHLDVYKRQP